MLLLVFVQAFSNTVPVAQVIDNHDEFSYCVDIDVGTVVAVTVEVNTLKNITADFLDCAFIKASAIMQESEKMITSISEDNKDRYTSFKEIPLYYHNDKTTFRTHVGAFVLRTIKGPGSLT